MSKNRNQLCGNCKHFVAGGLCELVKGQIKAKDTCDLFEYGNPQTMDSKVNPKYIKNNVNYRPGFMVETMEGEFAQKVIQMEHELLARGIPEEEVHRAVIAYFSGPEPPSAMQWPGPVTGLDLAATISTVKVPDTGVPLTDFTGLPKDVQPYPTPNKSPYGIGGTDESYPANPTPDPNSIGSLSNTYNVLNPPYPYESSNWTGTASDVNSQPSMYGEHGYNVQSTVPPFPPNYEGLHSDSHIHSKAIQPSGAVTEIKRKRLQEAISNLRSEFEWLTDDYISNAKKLANDAGGELYLIRAAGETITDHTGEGEPYRRKLSSEELNAMARTAIGKSMDINHQPEFETDATILDVEFDKNRKEMQMLVVERDPQIIDAIDDGKITAVSINGGMPRSEKIEPCNNNCSDNNCELCLVPQGVVLGELDGIGMTWVVTDKNGLYWNNHHIPSAQPGIKFTVIEAL